MFRCESCGDQMGANESQHEILETRTKEYDNSYVKFDKRSKEKKTVFKMSTGTEIVSVMKACKECYNIRNGQG